MIKTEEASGNGHPNLDTLFIADGLARLIVAQYRFAEEFGLSSARVFPHGAEPLWDRELETVLERWLCQGEDLGQFEWLLADLAGHQLALTQALDGVAVEAVAQIGSSHRRQAELATNPVLRHLRLVLPGFLTGYIRARESGMVPLPAKEVK